jgi:hypothetical protein
MVTVRNFVTFIQVFLLKRYTVSKNTVLKLLAVSMGLREKLK